jgi:hypothetical protein
MSEYERILRYRRVERLRALDAKGWQVGSFVRAPFDMTDYEGEPFATGETGTITRVTRSTIDVRDPRGHVHRGRLRRHFRRSR